MKVIVRPCKPVDAYPGDRDAGTKEHYRTFIGAKIDSIQLDDNGNIVDIVVVHPWGASSFIEASGDFTLGYWDVVARPHGMGGNEQASRSN